MKIKITLFILLLISCIICNAQVNLVFNPGFLGIGTNFTPQYKLNVDGNAAANIFIIHPNSQPSIDLLQTITT